MANAPRFTKTIVPVPIVKLTDNTLTTILAANANYDSRITGITVSSDDSSIQNIALFINDGVSDCPVGTIPIPIGAGVTVSIPAIGIIASLSSVFRERDNNGVTIYNLPIGFSLKAKMAAVTAGRTIYIRPQVELYD